MNGHFTLNYDFVPPYLAHIRGTANKSNPLPCFVIISTTNRIVFKKIYTAISHPYLRTTAKLY